MYKDKEITNTQTITHRTYFCSKCDKKLDEVTSYDDGCIAGSSYYHTTSIRIKDKWYYWEDELCDECYENKMAELTNILVNFGFKQDEE